MIKDLCSAHETDIAHQGAIINRDSLVSKQSKEAVVERVVEEVEVMDGDLIKFGKTDRLLNMEWHPVQCYVKFHTYCPADGADSLAGLVQPDTDDDAASLDSKINQGQFKASPDPGFEITNVILAADQPSRQQSAASSAALQASIKDLSSKLSSVPSSKPSSMDKVGDKPLASAAADLSSVLGQV